MDNELRNKTLLLTPGELQFVKMVIILTVMVDVLQRDINRINQMGLKLNELYTMTLTKTQDRVHSELKGLKEELQRRDINIYEEIRSAEGLQARFRCRGYDHKLLLQWEKVRKEILERSSQYWGLKDSWDLRFVESSIYGAANGNEKPPTMRKIGGEMN